MATRKPKIQPLTDIRVVNIWRTMMDDDSGQPTQVLVGWELQVQRGTDEWEKLHVENVLLGNLSDGIIETS